MNKRYPKTENRHRLRALFKSLALFSVFGLSIPQLTQAQSLVPDAATFSDLLYVRVGVMNSAVIDLKQSEATKEMTEDFSLVTVSVPIVRYLSDTSSTLVDFTSLTGGGALTNGIADLNPIEIPFFLAKPTRFVISDGTLWKPFIAVDHQDGTRLDLILRSFIAKIYGPVPVEKITSLHTLDQVLEQLNTELPKLIHFQTSQLTDNPLERFEDAILSQSASLKSRYEQERASAFKLALSDYEKSRAISSSIFKTNIVFPAVPLERYLAIGEGRCIHIALAASLILEKLRIPHRFVLGSNVVDEVGGRGVGHSWIELPDGRIFDAAWNIITLPGERHSKHPSWFKFGNEKGQSFRFPYERFNMMSY